MRVALWIGGIVGLLSLVTSRANGAPFFFSTGDPDGKIATASRPGDSAVGKIEIESADDFILPTATQLNSATFTGLLPANFPLASIGEVRVEIYRVFPLDSQNPPSGNVPTRANSPSDVAFLDRDTAAGNLTFTTTLLNPLFSAANSVVNGINKSPNQFTGGEGATRGEEVLFTVQFTQPIVLPADHYFFIPQVALPGASDNFLWLSAPKPITGGTGPFNPDLQSWIRNANLDPDWLRIGTDITGQGPFNGAFSLAGVTPPEVNQNVPLPPAVWSGLATGLGALTLTRIRRKN
jgi:hypothetical protein